MAGSGMEASGGEISRRFPRVFYITLRYSYSLVIKLDDYELYVQPC